MHVSIFSFNELSYDIIVYVYITLSKSAVGAVNWWKIDFNSVVSKEYKNISN